MKKVLIISYCILSSIIINAQNKSDYNSALIKKTATVKINNIIQPENKIFISPKNITDLKIYGDTVYVTTKKENQLFSLSYFFL
jgi:hypothetical protein